MSQCRSSEYFCRNVRTLRKKYGLTQKQMAEIMNTSVYSVRLLEQGKLPLHLPYTVLYGLADYFKLPADIFFLEIL